jgi:hypothetical protein
LNSRTKEYLDQAILVTGPPEGETHIGMWGQLFTGLHSSGGIDFMKNKVALSMIV